MTIQSKKVAQFLVRLTSNDYNSTNISNKAMNVSILNESSAHNITQF